MSSIVPGGPGVTRFATRGHHRLSYESSGEAAGTPLLALHDLLVDRGQLRQLAAALVDMGFRVTLPDARGHGASSMLSGPAHAGPELAGDARAVLDAEGLPAAHVVGVGWGAASALALAVDAPGNVLSLSLIAPYLPAVLGDHPAPEAQRYAEALHETIQQAAHAAQTGQIDHALDLYLGIRWGSGWRERLTKPRLGAIRRAAANLGPLLAGMAPDQVDRAALRAIDRPVTLYLRHDAPAFERWNAEVLRDLIPNARIQSVTIATADEGEAALAPDWAPVLTFALLAHGS